MVYFLYNVLLAVVFLVALPFVPLLALFGSKYRAGLGQRLGIYPGHWTSSDNLAGGVWIHAASVGEVTSAFPLIKALRTIAPQHKLLLSSFTASGNCLGQQTSEADAVIFLPLDLLWIVRRALNRFKPRLLIVIE